MTKFLINVLHSPFRACPELVSGGLGGLYLLFFILSPFYSQAKIHIKTGIEVLKESNFKVLEGKRVGLIRRFCKHR